MRVACALKMEMDALGGLGDTASDTERLTDFLVITSLHKYLDMFYNCLSSANTRVPT